MVEPKVGLPNLPFAGNAKKARLEFDAVGSPALASGGGVGGGGGISRTCNLKKRNSGVIETGLNDTL